MLGRYLGDGREFGGMIVGEGVDRDEGGDPVDRQVLQLLAQVGAAFMHLVGVLGEQGVGQWPAGDDVVSARVGLQAADGGHEDGGVGRQTGRAALDVEEAFGPHVGPEPGLGEQEVGSVDAELIGDHRRVAGGDVAEGSGVHQHRRVLDGLHEVGFDGFSQNHRHRPGNLEFLGGDRRAPAAEPDDDLAQPFPQIGERRCQRQASHDFGRSGDVEAGGAGHPVLRAATTDGDVAQRPIVDVEDPSPRDVGDVEVELVAVEEVGVELIPRDPTRRLRSP